MAFAGVGVGFQEDRYHLVIGFLSELALLNGLIDESHELGEVSVGGCAKYLIFEVVAFEFGTVLQTIIYLGVVINLHFPRQLLALQVWYLLRDVRNSRQCGYSETELQLA